MKAAQSITAWQRKQATLLTHFSSLEYIKDLQRRLNEIVHFSDSSLDQATLDNRDAHLRSKRWGNRNTSQNWSSNAWQFLADFQKSLARDISNRAFQIYARTGRTQCERGLAEYSTLWLAPDEQMRFDSMLAELSRRCVYLDDTAYKAFPQSRWDDFGFAVVWKELEHEFQRIPKFELRPEITCSSGSKPPRTGVYLPINDPHGAAQFAWTGDDYGKLLPCQTFNELGVDAINQVGRDRLWLDDQAMFNYATQRKHNGRFDRSLTSGGIMISKLAPSSVAREAFVSIPREWCLVELIEGEFEEIDNTPTPHVWRQNTRVEGGGTCRSAGFYFTPVNTKSRRFFTVGELMPDLGSPIGKTIWQWDEHQ